MIILIHWEMGGIVMYKRCTTEKATLQQRQFEVCLLAAMQNKPYREINVSSLCEQAGLPRMTFYRLFDSKDDLLYALIDHTLTDHLNFFLPEDQISSAELVSLQNFFAYWHEQKPLLDVLRKNNQSALLIQRAIEHTIKEESDALRRLAADNTYCGNEILAFFISGLFGLIVQWHESGYAKTVAEISGIMHQLLINPPIRFPMPSDNL